MKEIVLKTTKRKAIPYIINLKCECGGKFIKVEPLVFDFKTSTVQHSCDKCGKLIYVKNPYPATSFFSDEPEEEFGECIAYEGIIEQGI